MAKLTSTEIFGDLRVTGDAVLNGQSTLYIGTSANLPLITSTDGLIINSSFGTAANTFCEGDDSRLSDSRTPTVHAIAGSLHSASTLADLNSKISDATLIDTGDSRLSDSRTCDNTFDSAATSRTNLGLGTVALLNTNASTDNYLRGDGTWVTPPNTNTTYSAGNGISLSTTTFSVAGGAGLVQEASGLKVVSHAGTAGSIGTINVGTGTLGVNLGSTSTTACAGNDSRLSDARTPTSHDHTGDDLINIGVVTFGSLYDNGTKTANFTIDPMNGQYQKVTINANCAMSITTPSNPCTVYIHIYQGSTGGSITFPTAKWVGGTAKSNTTTATTGHDLLMIHFYGSTNYIFELMGNLS